MYEVLLERSVERALKRLSQRDFSRILAALKELASNPRPSGCKKLVGGERDLARESGGLPCPVRDRRCRESRPSLERETST